MDEAKQSWTGFLGGLVSGATASFTSYQQAKAAQNQAQAAQFQQPVTAPAIAATNAAPAPSPMGNWLLIGGAVVGLVLLLVVVFKK